MVSLCLSTLHFLFLGTLRSKSSLLASASVERSGSKVWRLGGDGNCPKIGTRESVTWSEILGLGICLLVFVVGGDVKAL